MATITIEDVPNEIVNKYGASIKYSNDFKFPTRKRADNEINKEVIYWNDNEVDNLGKTSTITSNSF